MKKKFMALFVLALFVLPLSIAEEEKATIEISDFLTGKVVKRVVSENEAMDIEKDLMEGKTDSLGIKFDFFAPNIIMSYGKGKVYIPFHRSRSFLRLVLFPIFFNYEKGITVVKFGANYLWRGKSIGDYGFMLGRQCGMMLGFAGVHIKISYKLRPDTHIFIGVNWFTVGNDRFL